MTSSPSADHPSRQSRLWGYCDRCRRWYEVESSGPTEVVFYGCGSCHYPPAQLIRVSAEQRPD